MKAARSLALVVVAAVGSTTQAQSPLMYYPNPYASPPGYGMQRGARPAPQPQPRIMYVPASPTPWMSGETIAAPVGPPTPAALPLPSAPFQQAAPATTTPNHEGDPVSRDEGGAQAAPFEKVGPARRTGQEPSGITFPRATGPARLAGPARLSEIVTGATDAPAESTVVSTTDGCPPEGCQHMYDPNEEWLPRGCWNLQILSGHFWDVDSSRYNWIPVHFRLGRVWNCEHLHGAIEPILDLTGGVVVNGDFGDWFIGPSVILRYNFVQPGTRFVPYIQGGVGFQYNDAYRDVNDAAGSRIELTAQVQAGFRVFLCKNWSLDFEGGLQHISNLHMSDRDEGINAVGATVGFSHFFGGRR